MPQHSVKRALNYDILFRKMILLFKKMIKESNSNPLTEQNLNIRSMWFILPGCNLHYFSEFALFILLKIVISFFL